MATIDKSKVKDDVQYLVTLAKPIQVGPSWVRPSEHPILLKGKVIKENSADVLIVENT